MHSKWADARVPEDVRDQFRIGLDVSDRAITTIQCRPSWRSDREAGIGHASPIARLRYTKSRGEWTLYWWHRNLKFHEYGPRRARV
ncbi:MAG: DUF3024 domain-containing protein [Actinomycetota bacterium]